MAKVPTTGMGMNVLAAATQQRDATTAMARAPHPRSQAGVRRLPSILPPPPAPPRPQFVEDYKS